MRNKVLFVSSVASTWTAGWFFAQHNPVGWAASAGLVLLSGLLWFSISSDFWNRE